MDKPKKTLVRNTKGPTPRIQTKQNTSENVIAVVPKAKSSQAKTPKSPKPQRIGEPQANHNLQFPTVNSTKNVKLKLNQLKENEAKHKTDVNLTTMAELITKQVNFPQDQPVFKDLIPLNLKQCNKTQPPAQKTEITLAVSHNIEPKLENFITARMQSEFSQCESSVAPSTYETVKNFKGCKHYWSHC